jgi:NIPSNAP
MTNVGLFDCIFDGVRSAGSEQWWWYRIAVTSPRESLVRALLQILIQRMPMKHVVEFRSLTLKAEARDKFHRLYIEKSLPLLKRWNMDVLAYGPSLHDENTYYVIRRFDSLAQREQMEDAFYGSDDWRQGPREAMVALIENYIDVVLELDGAAVQELRDVRS